MMIRCCDPLRSGDAHVGSSRARSSTTSSAEYGWHTAPSTSPSPGPIIDPENDGSIKDR